jgi:hypothetical protein
MVCRKEQAAKREMNSLTKSHKYVCKPKIYICSWVYDATIERAPTIYTGPDQRSNPGKIGRKALLFMYILNIKKKNERVVQTN